MEIKREDVLKYLGSNNKAFDHQLEELLESCITEIKEIAKPLYTYETFNIEVDSQGVKLVNQELYFKGNSIITHLQDSMECVILAATLGVEVDRRIKRYQLTSLTRAVILDACASATIEALCDEAQEEIRSQCKLRGLFITSRFSPGYGDLAIEYQPRILQCLKGEQKIGLMVTDENILVPRKSVTAIIGLTKTMAEEIPSGCGDCKARFCIYRREENICADSRSN